MRTGRPVIKRTRKSITRDIAALKRLRKSIVADKSLDAGRSENAVSALSATIERLEELSIRMPTG